MDRFGPPGNMDIHGALGLTGLATETPFPHLAHALREASDYLEKRWV